MPNILLIELSSFALNAKTVIFDSIAKIEHKSIDMPILQIINLDYSLFGDSNSKQSNTAPYNYKNQLIMSSNNNH